MAAGSDATSAPDETDACVGSPLMRISTFCSPRSERSRRRRNGTPVVGEDTVTGETGGDMSVAVAVAVRILDDVPSPSRTRRRKHRQQGVLDDLSATIYTNDPSLLSKVGAFEGSTVCCLSSQRPSPCSGRKSWSPVLIRLLPKKVVQDEDDETTFSGLNVSGDDTCISASAIKSTIYVPPCVAASAGLFQFAPASLECAFLRRIDPTSANGTNGGASTRLASKVVVREMAAPTVQIGNAGLSRDKDIKRMQDESLRRYFLREGEQGIRDDAPRLMALGTLFAVLDIRDGEGATAPHLQDVANGVRFYEVTSIVGDDNMKKEEETCAYVVSLSTKLTLEEGSGRRKWPRRLPILNQASNFAVSVFQPLGGLTKESHAQSPRVTSQHPSIGEIVDKLLMPLSNSLKASDYMTLVVGSDSDRIDECVRGAANIVGMRCISVGGLAAFDYRNKQQRHSANEDEKQKSIAPVTGSLAEKLSGLQAAIDMASRSMPCTIFIKDVDKELTAADVDAETRTEEEKRFAVVLSTAIAQNPIPCDVRSSAWNYSSPPIQFVISSSTPLPPGPLSSLSTGNAVNISRPDSKYARQIWESAHSDSEQQGPLFDEVRSQLLGRTADEINYARKEMLAHVKKYGDKESPTATLHSIFNTIDKGPIIVSDGGGSRLSSSLIPNVKWEDVGGLSHVRSEVMDAIELPLQHPELFSRGGRSGICLFGPPGTGKTLVAKAVATECGLPFLSVKGPELLGSYVGESEANVRAAFQNAREAAAASAGREKGGAAILFFDELDSLAPRRGGVGDGGGVMERVVATLLGEMDSGSNLQDVESVETGRVFVIGATNRPDLLDPSLLRPGRFDRLVYLGLAQSREDRIKILVAQTRKFIFEREKDAHTIIDEVIDSIPVSLSGADLSAVAKGALMRSMKRLCDSSDAELARIRRRSDDPDAADIETVVNNWGEQKLVPKVRAEDFVIAAKDVTPSVSAKELANYERLKEQFCA